MVVQLFLLMVLFTTLASGATKEEDFYVHNHSDDYEDYEYEDEPRDIQTDKPTRTLTNKPVASYEVTEIVDDIPNNVSYTGPVLTNFTIYLPLNNATEVKNSSNTRLDKNETKDKEGLDNFFHVTNEIDDKDHNHIHKVNKNLKKNTISIFHLNAEFDDDKPSIVQNININKLPNFGLFNVRDQVDRFKHGVVNHIHNVNNKVTEVNNGFLVPNLVAGPIAFFRKLHKKGAAAATNLHKIIFGHFDDY